MCFNVLVISHFSNFGLKFLLKKYLKKNFKKKLEKNYTDPTTFVISTPNTSWCQLLENHATSENIPN